MNNKPNLHLLVDDTECEKRNELLRKEINDYFVLTEEFVREKTHEKTLELMRMGYTQIEINLAVREYLNAKLNRHF